MLMHMSNKIILNLAFTPRTSKLVHAHAKPNCVQPCIHYFERKLINCINNKDKMTNIGHWKFITPKNLLMCMSKYITLCCKIYFQVSLMFSHVRPSIPTCTFKIQWMHNEALNI